MLLTKKTKNKQKLKKLKRQSRLKRNMLFQQLQHYRSININNANKILLFIDIPNSPQVENKQTSVIMTNQMWNWNKNLVIIQYKTTWKPIQTNIQPLAATFAIVFKVPHQWVVGSFSYLFRNFCICFYAPLASFVYINRRHSERGQVKAERKSRRLLSCRLSLLPAGSPQKFMPHRPERSSPQTKLARTGRSDLTHRRAASSTLPPCWQPTGSVLLTVTKFVSSSHWRCDQGRPKEDSEQSVRLFVYCYFYRDSLRSWYLRFSSRLKCESRASNAVVWPERRFFFF